eukprot:TRINITY_DN1657_c0_g1_i1.p1 TRINITY_DN1657_c0_g1~~TRINITY_DN1657_c0_g1_i1.p1  ORF type:complete len:909 (+),score=151.26 TRINITY_DN1657_c0_g1_i1:150-2876(+)
MVTKVAAAALFLLSCICVALQRSVAEIVPNGYRGVVGHGYRLKSVVNSHAGSGIVGYVTVVEDTKTYGDDISDLIFTVRYETPERLHVHITDVKGKRWEIPEKLIPRGKFLKTFVKLDLEKKIFSSSLLAFSYTSYPFGFAITRLTTGEVLFNSTPPTAGQAKDAFGGMVFKDQYLELSTQLPEEAALYGLGESTRPDGLRLSHGRTYTLWAADIPSLAIDVDLYGAYPFYLDVRKGGSSHGVLLLNSNGMDVSYGYDSLTYRVVGGVFDFYFFAGPSPLSVVSQYTDLVGKPAAMPYWSFGFHQCKYGYKNVEELEYVVAKYKESNIPLDVMWTDIDYMDGWRDFTLDPVNFPEDGMQKFVEKLHADGQKYVVIIDPGIMVDDNYTSYVRGLEADIFVKNAAGENYLGQVWPGPVYFPDFLNPNTLPYWTREISDFHKILPYDGLWIDMNEPSNFCSGSSCVRPVNQACPTPGAQTTCCLICEDTKPSRWDDPPYYINYGGDYRSLGNKTVATSALHYGGVLAYNAHNLYGLSEAIATERGLKAALGTRPFVLSRSTFVGAGKYTAHWTGDNGASFKDLAYSIVSTLNSGLFGVPMVGADICGFGGGGTTEELCNRWIQLGAFYPFSRNHAANDSPNQELYVWDTVATSGRNALGLRYRLLPYFYTLSYEAHKTGHPIARPLFFEFVDDPVTLGINGQFLVGSAILVSPVLEDGARSVKAYFPKGTWYNLFDFSLISGVQGSYQVLQAPLEVVNVHVHEGSIIPLQESKLTTTLARKTPFSLLVVFSAESSSYQSAHGHLFLDGEGEIKMRVRHGRSTYVKYSAALSGRGKGSVKGHVGSTGAYASKEGLKLQTLTILGLKAVPSGLLINEAAPSSQVKVTYNPSLLRADISDLDLPVGKDFTIRWL